LDQSERAGKPAGMRNNETGEFELVVGNRQLLSGFFIVVVLFAVAFAMGYVVGENSRTAKAQTDLAAAGAPGSAPGEPRPQPSSGAPVANPAASQPTDPSIPAAAPADPVPQPTTQPSREVPQPVHEVAPPKREEPKREEQPKREPAPPAHDTKASAPVQLTELASGSYWQVLATANRESAQDMVRTLQDKGLPASLTPGPNGLTRVVVGPYRDTAALGKAKAELEGAGLRPSRLR
jgi:outer membrane biosynthesis protein TonB